MARPKHSDWSSDMTLAPHDRFLMIWGKTDITKKHSSTFVAKWSDVYNSFISRSGWVVLATRWAEIV